MGVARFPELERAVMASVQAAVGVEADAYLFLGDLCDPDCGSVAFRCVELLQRATVMLLEGLQRVQVHHIAGNHDVCEDGSGDTTLTPLRALEHHTDRVYVHERPRMIDLQHVNPDGSVEILWMQTLPFCATSHAYDPAALPGLMTADVIAGHLAVPGAQPGEETTEMPRGREVLFPLDRIAERATPPRLLLNGHYHRRQHTNGVHIPGSLARLTYAERDNAPGWLVVDL